LVKVLGLGDLDVGDDFPILEATEAGIGATTERYAPQLFPNGDVDVQFRERRLKTLICSM
jgi:hypothetical protein